MGNGFDVPDILSKYKKIAVVGGGIGTAPMFQLTRELAAAGAKPDVFFGFRDTPYCMEEYRSIANLVKVSTDTGAVGFHGFVTQLARRCYRELSGGQQQRVLLARALCATQKMLLLDEPVSGLDPKVTAEMYTLIEKLNREDGITVIMISHDVAAAVRYASHILHIGDTVFFGAKADYLQSPQGRLFSAEKGGDSQ